MKKRTLSKSDIKKLNEQLADYSIKLNKKDNVELIEDKYYSINNNIQLFIQNNILLPTLTFLLKNPNALKQITVDMGAIKFVINGADIMRPGITNIQEDIKKDEYIVIIDENNKKPLAIGQMLLSSQDCKKTKSGKVILNIHYIGDETWNFCTAK